MTHIKMIGDLKQRGIDMLMEEIQKEIQQQEKFIISQNQLLLESEESLISLTDCNQVLKVALSLNNDQSAQNQRAHYTQLIE